MIHLTSNAKEQLSKLLAEKASDSNSGLRLFVEKGGCAGMQYSMKVAEQEVGDQVFGDPTAQVFVDPESLVFLNGSTVDYSDDLTESGFKIENPQAARSCGCGTSFEPADAETEPAYDSSMDGEVCGGEKAATEAP